MKHKAETMYGQPVPTFPEIGTHLDTYQNEARKLVIVVVAFCYVRFQYRKKWYQQKFVQEFQTADRNPVEAMERALGNINREIYLNKELQLITKDWVQLSTPRGYLHGLDKDQRSEKERLTDRYLNFKKNEINRVTKGEQTSAKA